MPLPDTVFYPPNPCQIIAHGASSDGIALFEVSINGTLASNIPAPDSQQTLATLNTACPSLITGENLIELRVKNSSGLWSETTQTTVFLAQDITVTETPSPLPVEIVNPTLTPIPTLSPTFIPTLTSTPQPVGSVTVERVSPNPVYIGRADCGPLDTTITARVTAPKGIAAVVLFYRFEPGNPSGEFQTASMKSMGGDLYQRTLNPTSAFGGSIPFDVSTLQYQIVVQQSDGDTSIRTPVLADVTVQACGSISASCSSYTDERTCVANGCNWAALPGTVPIFACQNP